jgi:MFS family permease
MNILKQFNSSNYINVYTILQLNNTMDSAETKTIARYALWVSILVSFMVAYISSSVNIALPEIGETFALNSIFLGWIPTSYLLFTGIFLIPFGKIADNYGKKKIITYGIIIFTLASILSAAAPSGTILLISRILQAVGGAMIFGNVYSMIASVFKKNNKSRALSVSVGVSYVGLSTGPILGGFLTQFLGWRSIFAFAVPFGVAALLILLKLEEKLEDDENENISLISTSVFALSLIGIMVGFSEITTYFGILALILGSLGVLIFIWLQKIVKNPLIHPKLLFDRVYIINNLTSLVNYAPGIFTIFILTLYLQNIKGLSPDQAGLLLSVQSVFIAIFSISESKLLRFLWPRFIAATGMALTAVGLTLFLFLGENTSLWLIVVALAVIGSGYGLSASSSTQISVGYFENKFYGVSTATLNTMRVVGQMTGMGVTLAVLNIFMGQSPLTPSNYTSFIEASKIPFLIFAILCYTSIYGYFIIRRKN